MTDIDLARLAAERGTALLRGPGSVDRLGATAAGLAGPGAAVLLVADPGLAASGLDAPARRSLAAAGLRVTVFTGLRPDPTETQIDAAADAARRAEARLVVGFGGGSALDVAKLAAAAAAADRGSGAYALMAAPLPAGALPVVAVPTTAGTGAEATRTAVYTLESGAKAWAWGDVLRPRVAVLDPLLTAGLPQHVTAATGIDALVHAIEAASSRRATPDAEAWALEAARLAARWLPLAMASPGDMAARMAMLDAAALAGFAIDACGTGVAHALGHALGAIGHVPHGRAVGLSLRVALAGNAAAAPAVHARIARAMGLDGPDDATLAAVLPAAFDRLLRQVGLQVDLAPDGLGPADAPRLAAAAGAVENRPMLDANCRALSPSEIAALAEAMLRAA